MGKGPGKNGKDLKIRDKKPGGTMLEIKGKSKKPEREGKSRKRAP
jgi:ubiquitin